MKIFLPLSFFLFMGILVQAQEVSNQSVPFISKKTATWCNPCGTWGWSAFKDIVAANEGNAILIDLHNSRTSKLNKNVATDLYAQFEQVRSTPAFYVGTENLTAYAENGGIYPTTSVTNVNAKAKEWVKTVDINAGFNAEFDGDNLKVNAKVKYFNPLMGEYYLGVYVSERNVVEYQSGIGNGAEHYNVLRAAMTSSSMGDLIADGEVDKDAEYTFEYSLPLESGWDKNNLRVFTVVWKKVDGKYEYVSSATQPIVGTSVNEVVAARFSMVPTVVSQGQNIMLDFSAESFTSQTTATVYTLTGQEVVSFQLPAHTTSYVLNTAQLSGKGQYVLAIQQNGTIQRRKFMVQ